MGRLKKRWSDVDCFSECLKKRSGWARWSRHGIARCDEFRHASGECNDRTRVEKSECSDGSVGCTAVCVGGVSMAAVVPTGSPLVST